jgi:hypothetical protein
VLSLDGAAFSRDICQKCGGVKFRDGHHEFGVQTAGAVTSNQSLNQPKGPISEMLRKVLSRRTSHVLPPSVAQRNPDGRFNI